MSFTASESVNASDYNALFTTLEQIRAKHAARAGLTSTQSKKLSDTSLGSNKNSVSTGEYPYPDNVSKVKGAVNFLATFAPNLTNFTSSVAIPSTGDLLKATELKSLQDTINAQNSQCAFCDFNSSFNSNFNTNFNSSFRSGFNGSFNSGFFSGNCFFNSGNFASFNSSWNGVFC